MDLSEIQEDELEQSKTLTKYIISMSRVAREFMINALEKESVSFSDLFVPLEQEDVYTGKVPSDTFFVTKSVEIDGKPYMIDSSLIILCVKLLKFNCDLRDGASNADGKFTILDLNNIATEIMNEINYCAYYINHNNISGLTVLHSEMLISDDDLIGDDGDLRPYSRLCKYFSKVLGISLDEKKLNISVNDRITRKRLNDLALLLSSLCEKYLIKLDLSMVLSDSKEDGSKYTIWYKLSNLRTHQLRNVLMKGNGSTSNPIRVRKDIFDTVNKNLNKLGFSWMLFGSEDDANILGFFIKIKYRGIVTDTLEDIIDKQANEIWLSTNLLDTEAENIISEVYARNKASI